MVGFHKKSQDSTSFSRSSGAKADGRVGAVSSGAAQHSCTRRTKPTARIGKGRRSLVASHREYKASRQMDSRCLALAESASGILGRPLDQVLTQLPGGPGAPAAFRDPAGPMGVTGPATGDRSDAVDAPRSIRDREASVGSMRSTQAGAGQVDTVTDITSDIEF